MKKKLQELMTKLAPHKDVIIKIGAGVAGAVIGAVAAGFFNTSDPDAGVLTDDMLMEFSETGDILSDEDKEELEDDEEIEEPEEA